MYLIIRIDFDRASSLICRNKMPARCNRWFLLQILLLAQHVSGTIMPIIRSSRVLYRRLLPVVFCALVLKLSVWCGAEGYVSGFRATASSPQTGHISHIFVYKVFLFFICPLQVGSQNNLFLGRQNIGGSLLAPSCNPKVTPVIIYFRTVHS